jgi:branched-chain amino acid transport system permease protein
MCLGAYAAAWAECDPDWKQSSLTGLPDFLQSHQYPFFVGLGGGEVLVGVVALIFGAAILRLSGLAASIATFAFLALIYNIFNNWDSVTGAMTSLVGIPTVIGPWSALAFVAVSIFIAYAFQTSGLGLMLRASRDDDVAASAAGVHVLCVRLVAFLISGLIAGAGGYLYANFLGVVAVESFYVELTFLTLTMLVVGGLRSLTGAVVGVVLVTLITELLRSAENGVTVRGHLVSLPLGSQEIVLGVVMALMLILRPNGITRGRELSLALLRTSRRPLFAIKTAKRAPEIRNIDIPGKESQEAP